MALATFYLVRPFRNRKIVAGEMPDVLGRIVLVSRKDRGRGGTDTRSHVREAPLELGERSPGDDAGSFGFERLRSG